MSHLMDKLLEHQRRLESDPAYTPPVVADFPGQDARVARLLVESAELRAERDKLRDMLHEQQRLSALLTMQRDAAVTMRRCAESELAARAVAPAASLLTPDSGCRIVALPLHGGAKAIVEVHYTPALPPAADDPGEPVECWVRRVLIATAAGDRLVPVQALIEALADDDAALRAVEVAQC